MDATELSKASYTFWWHQFHTVLKIIVSSPSLISHTPDQPTVTKWDNQCSLISFINDRRVYIVATNRKPTTSVLFKYSRELFTEACTKSSCYSLSGWFKRPILCDSWWQDLPSFTTPNFSANYELETNQIAIFYIYVTALGHQLCIDRDAQIAVCWSVMEVPVMKLVCRNSVADY